MSKRRSFKPVKITINGKVRTVYNVVQAGNTLLNDWPDQTAAAKVAERLVLDVFNDAAEPEQVRRAFITAAKASDIKYSS
ncbi:MULTISPECIES: DUF982 domain-containing protein [unclassified Rhizobium]|uniref:DUF982 domain-containing protein n=1 Tax=unclassified Rhizobium TaxID=2613769 RepID=UPI001A9A00A4|nr:MULTISPECIES: DUF982 domain-containing protein [unclassified Rhizobium]MBX5160440.1 DUF982 domain-containing protein [Rhizobium sp. NZLR8]MBX5165296.1 DUF982 domain-containing protein [Rhizobium sp. NZLR4b]MBX5172632.1 DUF982 domain-containing protein [Rhizobium sp. NZLR1b]MBX5197581.1 DUF982 domain-containing protein [Rhizobium sp. NZLR10]MBX5204343.1 DUF982 domain-containing protein [Rhizobium sp. NZLR1]